VNRVRVHIDRILDHVPGTPEQVALVQAYAMVKMIDLNNPDDTYLTFVDDAGFEGYEEDFFSFVRTIEIVLEIWRNTSQEVEHGKVETMNGQRYIVFGPNEKYPVPANWDQLPPAAQESLMNLTITPPCLSGFRGALQAHLRSKNPAVQWRCNG